MKKFEMLQCGIIFKSLLHQRISWWIMPRW